jgi:hypothetical protein
MAECRKTWYIMTLFDGDIHIGSIVPKPINSTPSSVYLIHKVMFNFSEFMGLHMLFWNQKRKHYQTENNIKCTKGNIT